MKFEMIKDLEDEKFRRLTGIKRFTFNKKFRDVVLKSSRILIFVSY
jgi:hypothetical protein